MSIQDLFQAGDLRGAVEAAIGEVRKSPSDAGWRQLLAELLCFSGEMERADSHLDTAGHTDHEILPTVLAIRQLIRAEQARQEFFTEGRLPSFLERPEGPTRLLLEASIRIREGALREASDLLAQVEQLRPRLGGVCDGQAFEDFRDLDDLTSCVIEVLTATGDYYWVPVEHIESIEFHPPARPRDLLWRRSLLTIRGGSDREVFIPVLYPGAAREEDDRLRLGRLTEWRGNPGEPVQGVGQRTFLIGKEDRSIMDLRSLVFEGRETSHEPRQDQGTG